MREERFFIDADELNDRLKTKNESRVILAVSRYDVLFEQDKHIVGAIHLDSECVGAYDDYIYSAQKCRQVFLDFGVTKETELILYSQATRVACKVAFVAYWLGLDNIKILNGGINAWLDQDYPTVEGYSSAQTAHDFKGEVPQRPEILVSTPDDLILTMNQTSEVVLASARNWAEHTGKTMGHDWNKGVGEIYGANFTDYETMIDDSQYLVHPSEYLYQWKKQGISGDKIVVFYCGTAWRASLAFFVAKDLGWEKVKLFDGSWLKWYQAHLKNTEKYPIQIGNPQYMNH